MLRSFRRKGIKRVCWVNETVEDSDDEETLAQKLHQFSQDAVDLLKSSPGCRVSFENFSYRYYRHFGKQFCAGNYGKRTLKALAKALPLVLQVLGIRGQKLLTLTHKAQVQRFTADLVKLLMTVPDKQVRLSSLKDEFCMLFKRSWDITEYGVSFIDDILCELPAGTVEMSGDENDTVISLPKKVATMATEPVIVKKEGTEQFCREVVDLLKHTYQCKIMLDMFKPAYHHHFGRRLTVSDYGFTELLDLFKAISHVAEVTEERNKKVICLTPMELRKAIGEKIVTVLQQKGLEFFQSSFTEKYGYPIPLRELGVNSIEELLSTFTKVSGNKESENVNVICFQTLERDIRILLQKQQCIPLHQFNKILYNHSSQAFQPSLFGLPSALSHLVAIETHNQNDGVVLSEVRRDAEVSASSQKHVPSSRKRTYCKPYVGINDDLPEFEADLKPVGSETSDAPPGKKLKCKNKS